VRILLLQAREPDDPMKDAELRSFALRAGLDPGHFESHGPRCPVHRQSSRFRRVLGRLLNDFIGQFARIGGRNGGSRQNDPALVARYTMMTMASTRATGMIRKMPMSAPNQTSKHFELPLNHYDERG